MGRRILQFGAGASKNLIDAFSLLSRLPIMACVSAISLRLAKATANPANPRMIRAFPIVGVVLVALEVLLVLLFFAGDSASSASFFGGTNGTSASREWSLLWLCWSFLLLEVVYSGAIHIDGGADFFEGIIAGKSPQERLRIMRDSRIGVYGVLVLFFLFSAKFFILWELFHDFVLADAGSLHDTSDMSLLQEKPAIGHRVLLAFFLSEVFSRSFMSLPLVWLKPSPQSRLAVRLQGVRLVDIGIGLVLAVALMVGGVLFGFSASAFLERKFVIHMILLPLILFFLVSALFSWFCHRKLKSVNGDCLGALQQILWLLGYIWMDQIYI